MICSIFQMHNFQSVLCFFQKAPCIQIMIFRFAVVVCLLSQLCPRKRRVGDHFLKKNSVAKIFSTYIESELAIPVDFVEHPRRNDILVAYIAMGNFFRGICPWFLNAFCFAHLQTTVEIAYCCFRYNCIANCIIRKPVSSIKPGLFTMRQVS